MPKGERETHLNSFLTKSLGPLLAALPLAWPGPPLPLAPPSSPSSSSDPKGATALAPFLAPAPAGPARLSLAPDPPVRGRADLADAAELGRLMPPGGWIDRPGLRSSPGCW